MKIFSLRVLFLAMAGFYSHGFAETPPDFPLEKGNYWVYRGEVKFLVPKNEEEKQNGGFSEPKNEVVTWKMEVIDTLERNEDVFAALIKGGPWDLAWYQSGKERGDYMILRVGKYLYYLYSGEEALELWEKLQASDSGRLPDLGNQEAFLDFPLATGKVFGCIGEDYINRLSSGRHCWLRVAGHFSRVFPEQKSFQSPQFGL